MQKIKNISLLLISFISVAIVGSSSVALARGSESESSGNGESSSSTSQTQTEQRQQSRLTMNMSSDDDRTSEQTELRKKASDEIAEKKKNIKEKSSDQRQKTCEQRKHGIQTKFDRISTNSQKIQERIDGVLTKATDYANNKNLNSGDIAGLITAANEAKAKSAASVGNLKTLKPTIDCTSNTVPSDIATFRAAAKDARDNLKAYRTSVKNLLKALIDASKTSNPTGNSEDSSNTQGGIQ